MAKVNQTRDEQQIVIDGFADSWVCKDGESGTFLVVADGVCLSVNESTAAAAIAAARAYASDNAQGVADAVATLRQRIG